MSRNAEKPAIPKDERRDGTGTAHRKRMIQRLSGLIRRGVNYSMEVAIWIEDEEMRNRKNKDK